MKNSGKIILAMLGLGCVLMTVSCEKESVDQFYEQDQISEKNLLNEMKNNKQQNGEPGAPCNSLIDLALVIDISGSMYGSRLDAAKSGAKLLVDELSSSSLSALVSYNHYGYRPFDLQIMDEDGQIELMSAIDLLNAGGGTNIEAGIIYAAEELTGDESLFGEVTVPSGKDRDDAQKLMILLSDGITIDPVAATSAANIAKAEGIRIITIAVDGADLGVMEGLASSKDDFYTTTDEGLEALFEEISGTICTTNIVALDIHPTSCPNPLSRKAKGVLPVSINGSETFDVNEIDINTVELEGLSPLRHSIADVSTLFDVNLEEPLDPYSCNTLEGDGYDDLVLKFDYVQLRAALGPLVSGDILTLEISGALNDGTEFTGKDIVIVR